MKANDFIKNMIKYCIPSVISAVLSIAVIPIVSRVFPPDDYGKINMFYSVGNMFSYLFLLGIDSAYIRFYFDEPYFVKRSSIFSMAFWISLALNVFTTFFVVIFVPEKASKYLFGEKNVLLLLALSIYVFSLVLFRLLSIETRMEGKSFLFNLQQVVLIITNRVAYVVAVVVTTNYQFSILIITSATAVLGLLFLLNQKGISDLSIRGINLRGLSYILGFAIPLMPTTVMVWLNNSAAKFVLSGYGDFSTLGVLTIATGLANVFSLIPSAFTTYWSPFMYRNYKDEQIFIKQVHNYVLIISIMIVILFYCLQDFVYFIVGENYRASQSFFMLIMMAPIQTLLCETTSYGIILSNRTRINMYISAIAVALNIGIGYLLYPIIGVYGVTVGIVSAALIQLIFKTYFGQKYYSSIEDKKVTFMAIVIILGLTVSNIWLYDIFIIRITITLFVLIVVYFLFRTEFESIKRFTFGLINKHSC